MWPLGYYLNCMSNQLVLVLAFPTRWHCDRFNFLFFQKCYHYNSNKLQADSPAQHSCSASWLRSMCSFCSCQLNTCYGAHVAPWILTCMSNQVVLVLAFPSDRVMHRIHEKKRRRRTNKFFSELTYVLAKHSVQCSVPDTT